MLILGNVKPPCLKIIISESFEYNCRSDWPLGHTEHFNQFVFAICLLGHIHVRFKLDPKKFTLQLKKITCGALALAWYIVLCYLCPRCTNLLKTALSGSTRMSHFTIFFIEVICLFWHIKKLQNSYHTFDI